MPCPLPSRCGVRPAKWAGTKVVSAFERHVVQRDVDALAGPVLLEHVGARPRPRRPHTARPTSRPAARRSGSRRRPRGRWSRRDRSAPGSRSRPRACPARGPVVPERRHVAHDRAVVQCRTDRGDPHRCGVDVAAQQRDVAGAQQRGQLGDVGLDGEGRRPRCACRRLRSHDRPHLPSVDEDPSGSTTNTVAPRSASSRPHADTAMRLPSSTTRRVGERPHRSAFDVGHLRARSRR